MQGIILVTGGAGFIGSNLAESLLKKGERVRILDDFSTGRKENISFLLEKYPERLEFIEGSILDRNVLKKVVSGVRYISHQAAIPSVQYSVNFPIKTNEANVTGTLMLLEEARNVDSLEKIIFAASSSAYGDVDAPSKIETLPVKPMSPYAAQKVMGEYYVKLYVELFDLPVLAFRYFNVFGPRQNPDSPYSAVIPLFIRAFLEDRPPVIYGDGEQSRDFTYVDNVVTANIKGFSSDISGEVINIACGEKKSLNELIVELQNITGKKIEPVYEAPRKGDVRHSLADVSKAKDLLKFEPAVSSEEGLRKTFNWYKENYTGS